MKTQNIEIRMAGTVTDPPDLRLAAEQYLGENFIAFIERYGENFTKQQLVHFSEELHYGPRHECHPAEQPAG